MCVVMMVVTWHVLTQIFRKSVIILQIYIILYTFHGKAILELKSWIMKDNTSNDTSFKGLKTTQLHKPSPKKSNKIRLGSCSTVCEVKCNTIYKFNGITYNANVGLSVKWLERDSPSHLCLSSERVYPTSHWVQVKEPAVLTHTPRIHRLGSEHSSTSVKQTLHFIHLTSSMI